MIEEILLRSRLDDTRRLYEIISEQKSTLQERLSAAGHQTAVGRALAYTSEPYGYSDALSGIGYYKLIEDLEAHFEERKGELVEKLKHLMGLLFRQDTLLVSVTCEEENYISVKKLSLNLKEKLETRASRASAPSYGHWARKMRASSLPARCSLWREPEITAKQAFPIQEHCGS